MTGYTLQDVESYARASCPAAFAIINDVVKYTFVKNTFIRQDGSTFEGHTLRIGYLDRKAYGDCWHAVCDLVDGQIATYHGRPGDKLVPAGEPFSRPATANNVSDTVYPFYFAMKHPLSTAKDEGNRTTARQEKRVRLLLLVEFAHLLTGRMKQMGLVTSQGHDILQEFVSLCELMQREKDRIAKKEARKVTSIPEKKSAQSSAQKAKPNESTKHAGSVPKRDLKRKATTDDGPHISTSQGLPKKQRTAHTAGVGNNNIKPATKGASLLKYSFGRIMGNPTTPRPVRSIPGPGAGLSNSNVPLAGRSNNTLLAPSSNITRSSPNAGETLTDLRTKLASANKQLETATKTIQKFERTITTKEEEVAKAEKEASRAKQVAQRWKKMYKDKQPKYETLQAKYAKLRAKYEKLKNEVSNLKIELDSDSD